MNILSLILMALLFVVTILCEIVYCVIVVLAYIMGIIGFKKVCYGMTKFACTMVRKFLQAIQHKCSSPSLELAIKEVDDFIDDCNFFINLS